MTVPPRKYGKAVMEWRLKARKCRYRARTTGSSPSCLYYCGQRRCTFESCPVRDKVKMGVVNG